ncbi:tachykinin-like peptides receptor 86C [Pygocentrus nattereri]|uniref:tachykinin-like peptides receptor 86C n=1 Tax=Pygocentrus nattereri TaxID=42514 RepID=UPI0008147B3B|nr:tachykinin-like peptides receptor 86C [Pygocentrus nattereri]
MNAKEWMKSIIRGFMCLSGIIGNHWLGFRSLPKSRSQLRTNDILFVNLALSNLITNYLVDLPDTLDFVNRWRMGKMYCGAFNFCSNLSETSSIFTTLFITVFWHQKLVGSLKRGGAPAQMDNVRLVAALLVGSWIAAVVFSLPQFFFVSVTMWNESLVNCVEYFPSQEARQIYETLYLTLANVVPIVGIVVASIQIAATLLQNQKRIKNTTRAGTRGGNPLVAEDQRRAAGRNAMTSTTNPTPPEFSSKIITSNIPNHEQTVRKSQDRSFTSAGNQVRAAKSVVAVATLFLICWLIHLLLSITSTVFQSTVVDEMTSYIGAVYTCIIPYIYLHGVKKLNCSSRD